MYYMMYNIRYTILYDTELVPSMATGGDEFRTDAREHRKGRYMFITSITIIITIFIIIITIRYIYIYIYIYML